MNTNGSRSNRDKHDYMTKRPDTDLQRLVVERLCLGQKMAPP
jgi:hypothetical protein